VTRTGAVEVGVSHFSTSKRKDFAAVFIRVSFKLVSVGSAVPCCTRCVAASATRRLVTSCDWYWTQSNDATMATRATVPVNFQLRKLAS
jgi:hypothetical protein